MLKAKKCIFFLIKNLRGEISLNNKTDVVVVKDKFTALLSAEKKHIIYYW